jgi:hypothetical protein
LFLLIRSRNGHGRSGDLFQITFSERRHFGFIGIGLILTTRPESARAVKVSSVFFAPKLRSLSDFSHVVP